MAIGQAHEVLYLQYICINYEALLLMANRLWRLLLCECADEDTRLWQISSVGRVPVLTEIEGLQLKDLPRWPTRSNGDNERR